MQKLIAVFLAAFATVAVAQDTMHDFKGVPLEISIDEFRSLPHPDGNPYTKVACTGEKVRKPYGEFAPPGVGIYDNTLIKIGVKRCVWLYSQDDSSLYRSANDIVPLKFANSGYVAYDYQFDFVPDEAGVLRLYSIVAVSNTHAYADTVEALQIKYGAPKIEQSEVQNKMGGSFPQTTAVWDSTSSSITALQRWYKLDQMAIRVESKRLSAIVKQAEEKEKSEQINPI